jgi:murein DD-endopeptidase MepM/ murein hydrolase activator NlpD
MPMSNRVGFLEGRAFPRLALTGLAVVWLAGCSSDVTRFADSGSPFVNPFSGGQTAGAAPTAKVAATPLAPPGPSPIASSAPTSAGHAPQPVGGSAVGWTAVGGSPVVVAQGETLDSLSSRYGVPAAALLSANGLSKSAEVHPGMNIVVPVYHANGAAVAAGRKPAEKTVAEASTNKDRKHAKEVAARDDKGKAELSSKERKAHAQEKAAEATSPAGKTSPSKPESSVVAKAEPAKPAAQGKKSAVDSAPTGNLENGAAQSKAPLAGAQADASGVEPEFRWPARGRIIQGFKTGGNDGINISVPAGTSVRAAENGVVVYSGDGLKGYGNLVLIKHPNGFVTAYANNGELDVKRGETVKRGQVIAKSGESGNVNSPQLHFELRKGSTPVDPTSYLAGL